MEQKECNREKLIQSLWESYQRIGQYQGDEHVLKLLEEDIEGLSIDLYNCLHKGEV